MASNQRTLIRRKPEWVDGEAVFVHQLCERGRQGTLVPVKEIVGGTHAEARSFFGGTMTDYQARKRGLVRS